MQCFSICKNKWLGKIWVSTSSRFKEESINGLNSSKKIEITNSLFWNCSAVNTQFGADHNVTTYWLRFIWQVIVRSRLYYYIEAELHFLSHCSFHLEAARNIPPKTHELLSGKLPLKIGYMETIEAALCFPLVAGWSPSWFKHLDLEHIMIVDMKR